MSLEVNFGELSRAKKRKKQQGNTPVVQRTIKAEDIKPPKKDGRPTHIKGKKKQLTIKLSEETADKITVAIATKLKGKVMNKSHLIEVAILDYLEKYA